MEETPNRVKFPSALLMPILFGYSRNVPEITAQQLAQG
jgi:hypothetical protein